MADVALRRHGPASSTRIIRVVLGAMLLLILGSMFFRSGLFSKKIDGIPEGFARLPVANGAIAPLQRIELAQIQFILVKKDLIAPDSVGDAQQIVGRTALAAIPDKSPFKGSVLGPRADESGDTGAIRRGWVAVTIDLDKLDAPLALLAPGSSVAVLAERETEAKGSRVAVVCNRALVLSPPQPTSSATTAANGFAGFVAARRSSAPQAGVTIQIPAEDAMRFVQAQRSGRLVLALLSTVPGDFLSATPTLAETEEPVEIIRGNRRSLDTSLNEKGRPASRPEKE
jgi:Flp pilus assembly protein CpaB